MEFDLGLSSLNVVIPQSKTFSIDYHLILFPIFSFSRLCIQPLTYAITDEDAVSLKNINAQVKAIKVKIRLIVLKARISMENDWVLKLVEDSIDIGFLLDEREKKER